MIFSQDGRNLLSKISFTPSIVDSEKICQELTPLMAPPKESGLFYFYITYITELI